MRRSVVVGRTPTTTPTPTTGAPGLSTTGLSTTRLSTTAPTVSTVGRCLRGHRLLGAVVAAATTVLALLGERLCQTRADLLAGHLHQTEARHLGDLVASTVSSEALDQPPQEQLTVARQHHVDCLLYTSDAADE